MQPVDRRTWFDQRSSQWLTVPRFGRASEALEAGSAAEDVQAAHNCISRFTRESDVDI